MANLYESVLDSGGGVTPTPITPSNSSPASMTAGTAYEPTTNGVAIESVTDITPSTNMPSLTAGTIYKPTGNGHAISTYTPLTPSNSSPVALSAQTIYRVTNGSSGGYAIESYSTTTLTTYGEKVRISTGMNNIQLSSSVDTNYIYVMAGNNGQLTLWTNSSPSSNFAGQTITLSQSYQNFHYIEIRFRVSNSDSTESSVLIPKETLDISTTKETFSFGIKGSSATTTRVRVGYAKSATQIQISSSYQTTSGSQTASAAYSIPIKIIGRTFY